MSKEEIYIEKFEPESIEHEPIPFAQLDRNVLQNIKNPAAGFIWAYLQSQPRTWKPNKHQIMKHFDISERTYERYIAFLRESNLVKYRRERYSDGTLGPCILVILNGNKFIDISKVKKEKLRNSNHTAKNGGMVEKINRLWIKYKNLMKSMDFTTPPKNHPVVIWRSI